MGAQPQVPLKVAVVFGTRPEAIKMAPLVRALRESPEDFDTHVIVTAQHRQMLDQVLTLFDITPDIDLDLMQHGQTLTELTSRVLLAMAGAIAEIAPDIILVHGDTTTTMATALSAYYHQIPVGHVEAGLRTYDKLAPWPEEMNRQIAGRIADLHFAPTEGSAANLLREGIDAGSIEVTGNTVIDALYQVSDRLDRMLSGGEVTLPALMACNTSEAPLPEWTIAAIERVLAGEARLVLITGHRRENFGQGFEDVCEAIATLSSEFEGDELIYPVHLNPKVMGPVHERLGDAPNVHLVPPLDYLPFVFLMKAASVILTDSGGIQEEAPGLGKPVLVMREVTERPEAVVAGTVKLVGTDTARIVAAVSALLRDEEAYAAMAKANNPYGDGMACGRITARLRRFALKGRGSKGGSAS